MNLYECPSCTSRYQSIAKPEEGQALYCNGCDVHFEAGHENHRPDERRDRMARAMYDALTVHFPRFVDALTDAIEKDRNG